MQGILINKNGTEYELEALTSWDICHGLGEPCDYFEVTALYDPDMLPVLYDAVRFRAENDGDTVFYGVVDEYIISIDEKGGTVTVNGRSLAALLMDNELPKCTHYTLSRSALLSSYVTPFGVTDAAPCPTLPSLLLFPVRDGDSAWSVLKRWCLKAAHTLPRFSKTGTLLMTGAAGTTKTLNADTQATAIRYRDERYGVLSKITVKNRVNDASYTVTNSALIARGGRCERYMYTDIFDNTISDPSQLGDHYNGEYQIERSKQGKHCIEVTVPELFFCFPGDTVRFTSTVLGVSGSYPVSSTHCWADSLGAGTVITLEV